MPANRAVAYLRRSVTKDGTSEVSREMQEAAVNALAERHGETIETYYVDWGLSGRTAYRPQWERLLADVRDGEVGSVYAYSLSRLARSVSSLAAFVQLCGQVGTAIRLVVDSVDTTTASGRMMASILGSVAEFESDVAAERARAAAEARRERGDRIGPRFYGESEQDDPDAVLAAYREAGSFTGTARLLNERGVRQRNGRVAWSATSVREIVARLAPDEVPVTTRRGARVKGAFTLSGLLRCPAPGCREVGRTLTGGRDRGRVRFYCHRGSTTPHLRSSVYEATILPYIQRKVASLHIPDEVEEARRDDAAALADIETRRARLVAMAEAGLALPMVRERMEALDSEADAIAQRTRALAVPAMDWTWAPDDINAVLRELLRGIELDPVTLLPVAYDWQPGLGDWVTE